MTGKMKVFVVFLVVVALGGVLFVKGQRSSSPDIAGTSGTEALPRLIDLSTSSCPACKAILPHLERLKTDYAGTLVVDIVDVWENPALGEKYKVRYVPTLVLLDEKGEVLDRREGFMALEDLVSLVESHGISRP